MNGMGWKSWPFTVNMILLVGSGLAAILQPIWSDIPTAMAADPQVEKLSVTIVPPVLLADENTFPVIYLQLLGSDGVPRIASHEIEVSLVSSNPLVANVSDVAQIPMGKSYAIAPLTTTSVSGIAVITVVVDGLALDAAEVRTVSGLEATPPIILSLEAAPGNMLPGARPPGRLSILLLDVNGRPVSASEELNVVLTSSNPSVVRMAEQVTIPKGEHFVVTHLESLETGSSTLSAVHSGYASEFIEVHVVDPGISADAMVVYLSPTVMRFGSTGQERVVIQVVDDKGIPVYFPCTQAHLASSAPRSVNVRPMVENNCDKDTQYLMGALDIGDASGTVTITTSASGLRPGSEILTLVGRTPSRLKAYLAPEKLLGVEATPGMVVIQVLDRNETPVNLHKEMRIKLVGSGEALVGETVIPAGRSFVSLELGRIESATSVEFWAVNPDLTSAHILMQSLNLPISLQLHASERPLSPADQTELVVQVQSSGKPLPRAVVTWTTDNSVLSLNEATFETDENGKASALFLAMAPGDGLVEVTVTKLGYEETKAEAMVAVVSTIESSNTKPPRLLGIPVLYLFLAVPALLLGYLGYVFLPAFRRRNRSPSINLERPNLPNMKEGRYW